MLLIVCFLIPFVESIEKYHVLAITANLENKAIPSSKLQDLVQGAIADLDPILQPTFEASETTMILFTIQESNGQWSNTFNLLGKKKMKFGLQAAKCVEPLTAKDIEQGLKEVGKNQIVQHMVKSYSKYAVNKMGYRTCALLFKNGEADEWCKDDHSCGQYIESDAGIVVNKKQSIGKGCIGVHHDKVSAFSCHFVPHIEGKGTRKKQMEIILNDANSNDVQKKSDIILIAGDFNHRDEIGLDGKPTHEHKETMEMYDLAIKNGYFELLTDNSGTKRPDFEPTYSLEKSGTLIKEDSKHPQSYCDHIYYKPTFAGTEGTVTAIKYNSMTTIAPKIESDHAPVYGLFKVEKKSRRMRRGI